MRNLFTIKTILFYFRGNSKPCLEQQYDGDKEFWQMACNFLRNPNDSRKNLTAQQAKDPPMRGVNHFQTRSSSAQLFLVSP